MLAGQRYALLAVPLALVPHLHRWGRLHWCFEPSQPADAGAQEMAAARLADCAAGTGAPAAQQGGLVGRWTVARAPASGTNSTTCPVSHPPQLLRSLVTSMHLPPQTAWPEGQFLMGLHFPATQEPARGLAIRVERVAGSALRHGWAGARGSTAPCLTCACGPPVAATCQHVALRRRLCQLSSAALTIDAV